MKNWKAVAGVVLVFVTGALSGAVVTHRVCERRIEAYLKGGPQAGGDLIVHRLARRLGLDARQSEQVRAIVLEAREEMKAVRKQVRPQFDGIIERAQSKVRAVLRPDQQEKFDRLVAERKARRDAGG